MTGRNQNEMKQNMVNYLKQKYNREMKEMSSAFALSGIDSLKEEPNFSRQITQDCLRRYKSVERRHADRRKFSHNLSYDHMTGPQDNCFS